MDNSLGLAAINYGLQSTASDVEFLLDYDSFQAVSDNGFIFAKNTEQGTFYYVLKYDPTTIKGMDLNYVKEQLSFFPAPIIAELIRAKLLQLLEGSSDEAMDFLKYFFLAHSTEGTADGVFLDNDFLNDVGKILVIIYKLCDDHKKVMKFKYNDKRFKVRMYIVKCLAENITYLIISCKELSVIKKIIIFTSIIAKIKWPNSKRIDYIMGVGIRWFEGTNEFKKYMDEKKKKK